METILKSRIILSWIADFFSSACCSKNRPNLNLYFVKMCHQVTCIQWLWLHLSVVSLNGQRHLYWIISGWLIYTIDILHLCTYFHIINVKNKSAIVILTLCAFSWYTARTCSSKLKSRVAQWFWRHWFIKKGKWPKTSFCLPFLKAAKGCFENSMK